MALASSQLLIFPLVSVSSLSSLLQPISSSSEIKPTPNSHEPTDEPSVPLIHPMVLDDLRLLDVSEGHGVVDDKEKDEEEGDIEEMERGQEAHCLGGKYRLGSDMAPTEEQRPPPAALRPLLFTALRSHVG